MPKHELFRHESDGTTSIEITIIYYSKFLTAVTKIKQGEQTNYGNRKFFITKEHNTQKLVRGEIMDFYGIKESDKVDG